MPVSDRDNLLWFNDRVRSRASDYVQGLGLGIGYFRYALLLLIFDRVSTAPHLSKMSCFSCGYASDPITRSWLPFPNNYTLPWPFGPQSGAFALAKLESSDNASIRTSTSYVYGRCKRSRCVWFSVSPVKCSILNDFRFIILNLSFILTQLHSLVTSTAPLEYGRG